jgi:hypothetical protein
MQRSKTLPGWSISFAPIREQYRSIAPANAANRTAIREHDPSSCNVRGCARLAQLYRGFVRVSMVGPGNLLGNSALIVSARRSKAGRRPTG